ncbi:uncharacterized protein LAESUDRAFT_544696 [Laetiporus sulphureus 93-53]|uniref:Uncharacterized protein n=1 Tax=Laetiporus sulphureus 93-53 TaxID=1314785 RepID=A0A165FNG7_9APHY|nr:uncharacterized protein LAESUDRAFT_544696 [Laetiporus sulphureus 93-53]KZT09232.1 hypothetical protein LAESUDRAFT_544696 [Laetiporus sulphureus 93-53]
MINGRKADNIGAETDTPTTTTIWRARRRDEDRSEYPSRLRIQKSRHTPVVHPPKMLGSKGNTNLRYSERRSKDSRNGPCTQRSGQRTSRGGFYCNRRRTRVLGRADPSPTSRAISGLQRAFPVGTDFGVPPWHPRSKQVMHPLTKVPSPCTRRMTNAIDTDDISG